MESSTDDVNTLDFSPMPPSSPPPPMLNPPMPPEMSKLDVTENNHLDIEQGLGDGSSNVDFECPVNYNDKVAYTKRKSLEDAKAGVEKKLKVNSSSSEDDTGAVNGPVDAEIKKMMEFDVLDEFNEDEDEQDDGMDASDSDSMSEGIDPEEIEAMLDESLKNNFGKPGRLQTEQSFDDDDLKHEVREKIVLKGKNIDQ